MSADRPGRERHVFATVLFAMLSACVRRVRYGYYYVYNMYMYRTRIGIRTGSRQVREIAEIDRSEIRSDYQRRIGFPRVSRPAHDYNIIVIVAIIIILYNTYIILYRRRRSETHCYYICYTVASVPMGPAE